MLLRFGSAPILFTLIVAGCTSSTTTEPDATITVINDEDFAITDIYIDPVGGPLGDNLLTSDLLPTEQITFGLDCDTYDVEMIDEVGGDCIVHDTDTCLNDAVLHVDNDFCTFSSVRDGKQIDTKVPRLPAGSATIRK
jgi:hypothetical protein